MRKLKRSITFFLLFVIMVTGAEATCLYVNASTIETKEIESSELETEENLKENSWRYIDGELIPQSLYSTEHPNAWKKVNGYFLNNLGEIIPGAVKKGIDVSEHNGIIDWNKVKSDGIDYAIIRCGYGSNYTNQDDKQWLHNVTECERLGIPYGVYLYSYADTLEKAKSEANHTLRLLKGHSPSYPVYYDLEDNKVAVLSSSMKGQIAEIFCNTIASAGYEVGIYSSLNWWNEVLVDYRFKNASWSKWVAQWNSKCTYGEKYDAWQCASNGKVNGINGPVDLNFWMGAEKEKLQGLNYDSNAGAWYYYKDNQVDWNYTGLASNENGWWYIKNGKLDWNHTGLVQNESGWWYVKDGGIDWNHTGLVQNESGWWYVKKGRIDWNHTGLVQNESGWWYVKDGRIDWNHTGLVQNESGWWYVKNGGIDWNYMGLAKNENGLWYIRNGKIDWGYSGTVSFEGKEYIVTNGFVQEI